MMLQGKVGVVTGAAQGLGRAIALSFADEGADVAVVDIDQAGAERVAQEIKNRGRATVSVVADVSKATAVEAMAQTVIEHFGRVDILVNNAAILMRKSFEETTEEDWDRALAVNLKGPFFCCKAFYPSFTRQRSGRIVNISSGSGKIGDLGSAAPYAASKAALHNFTFYMAQLLGPFGVTVNAVAPGTMNTESYRELFPPEVAATMAAKKPLGRIAEPEEVAAAVVFLASNAASHITGEILDVNGGSIMD